MPLVGGREIIIKPGQTEEIQKRINAADQLTPDLKSEVEPTKERTSNDYDLGFGNFSLFQKESLQTVRRKDRYKYFKEMDEMEFIHRALEIVADDSTQTNDEGNTLKIYSDNEKVKGLAEDLFFDRLDLNNELWSIVYESCKMGDNFYEVIVDDYKNPRSVIYLRYLEPDKVERIEKNGRLSHFTYKTKDFLEQDDKEKGIKKGEEVETEYRLQPWQIVHFKIESKEFAPYGLSLLNPGVTTFRRLSLLEDVMLVYRLSRAPERRVFYIDVGNLNAMESRKFLNKIKSNYRTEPFIDEDGKLNRKAHLLSITSDIFVPVREGSQGTKIDTLQGGEALNNIDDMKYFRDKILRTMNIPPAYLGDDSDKSRGSLAQLDIKFSRFIERIQAQIIKGLNKILALELFFNKVKKDELNNFYIEMTPPSNIKEVTEIDIINQRMSLIGNIQNLNIFPTQWMLKNILKFSEKEIADILLYKNLEGTGQAVGGGAMPGGAEAGGAPSIAGEMPGEPGAAPQAGISTPEVGQTPPAEGNLTGAGMENAGTIVKLLGKDFLLENKESFFKILKYINKEEDKEKLLETLVDLEPSLLIENVKKIFEKRGRQSNNNNVENMFIINELGGLDFGQDNTAKRLKLFESYNTKKFGKIERKYKTKSILLG